MSKAFTRELEGDEDGAAADLPRDFTNYITPAGLQRLRDELAHLWVVGDVVTLRTPRGSEEIEILDIRYEPLP